MMENTFRAQQLVILSGKGGTGKTSLSAAFAHLACSYGYHSLSVLVDADVDAANLSLALLNHKTGILASLDSQIQETDAVQSGQEQIEAHDYIGSSLAEINQEKCCSCGRCIAVCRYDAILQNPGILTYEIDPIACDGCAACVYACPEGAIRMMPQQEGLWFHTVTHYGSLFHAELFPGRDNSGKLVTVVKQQARLRAEDMQTPLIIIDGPPGIGCPVISACAGSHLGLIVTEPGIAGIHDLERVLGILQHFRVPAAICINKADIYPQGAEQIRSFAASQGVEILGDIPYDMYIARAMIQGKPITAAYPEAPSSYAIRKIWELTALRLLKQEAL